MAIDTAEKRNSAFNWASGGDTLLIRPDGDVTLPDRQTLLDCYSGIEFEAASGVTLTAADVNLIWDELMEDGFTARQLMRMMSAVLLGKNTGLSYDGGKPVYRSIGDVKDRVSGTVDKFGNRIDTTLDGT